MSWILSKKIPILVCIYGIYYITIMLCIWYYHKFVFVCQIPLIAGNGLVSSLIYNEVIFTKPTHMTCKEDFVPYKHQVHQI